MQHSFNIGDGNVTFSIDVPPSPSPSPRDNLLRVNNIGTNGEDGIMVPAKAQWLFIEVVAVTPLGVS